MAVVTTQLDHDARLFSVVSRLLRESGWRHARGYAVAMALAAVVAGTTGAILFLVRDVVDDILVDKNKAALLLLSGAVMATFLVRGLAMFGYSTILAQIGNAIILEQQQRMFRKILSCEPSALSGSSSGEILNVIGAGANGARQLLNALATAIGRDALNLIVLLGSMIWLDPWLTLGMLAGAPLIAVLISTITKRLRAQVREHMQVTGKLNDRIRSGVQGLRTIKAFGMEERFGDAMGESAERLRKVGNKVVITGQRIAPFMEIIAGFAIGAGIAIVGWGAINEGRTPGELVAFLVAALLAYDPARRLVQARTSIEQGLVAVRTMFTFIDDEGPLVDPPGATPMRIAAGEVRFEAVSFAYEPEHPVLRDVSFTAPA
ncbi:MAG: ABC transporter ATP-binding protein, partial [Pseudomonadota bacterium]